MVNIVGGGLAGTEAAWFLASRGISVKLFEQKRIRKTPAQTSDRLAELVCSNSLKNMRLDTAPGLLKQEMSSLGSLVLQAATSAAVPAGDALGVDRDKFSDYIEERILKHPLIETVWEPVDRVPDDGSIWLLATGPLTSPELSVFIQEKIGGSQLAFFDAIAPILVADSIDRSIVFEANRYDKGGEAAYLNCPFTKDEYEHFINVLGAAEKVQFEEFEKNTPYFQACQPIERILESGRESLRFGPMKPVGLDDPRTGRRPWAAVQLRSENQDKTAYNMVGFQTKLKYKAQAEVFRLIPGLQNVEFFRYGSIHRNTYVNTPNVCNKDFSLKNAPHIFIAGQVMGVEGYTESAAMGQWVAREIYARINNFTCTVPAATTAFGALIRYLQTSRKDFQPMNINFGIFDSQKLERQQRCVDDFNLWKNEHGAQLFAI